MAFTGTATVVQVADGIVRITGLSLAAGAAGTIGLNGATVTPGVRLPASFQPKPYKYDGAAVALADSIDCTTKPAAVGVATAIPVSVVKTGTDNSDFTITITNTHGSLATPNVEIFVKYHE